MKMGRNASLFIALLVLFGCHKRPTQSATENDLGYLSPDVVARLNSDPNDPVGDARRAVAARDFRLYWEGGGWEEEHVMGADCTFPIGPSRPLQMGYRYVSDYRGNIHNEEDFALDQRLAVYGPAYNRAVIADSAFPYADLCGPEPIYGRYRILDPARSAELVLPPRPLTDRPQTLGEAARRGSPASIERLLRGLTPAQVDRPDDLGITPLGWAVIARRSDAARTLIAKGADPLGGRPRLTRDDRALPLPLALTTGQDRLAEVMLSPSVIRRLTPWPISLLICAVAGDNRVLAQRILSGPHEAIEDRELRELARNNVSPEMGRMLLGAQQHPIAVMAEPRRSAAVRSRLN